VTSIVPHEDWRLVSLLKNAMMMSQVRYSPSTDLGPILTPFSAQHAVELCTLLIEDHFGELFAVSDSEPMTAISIHAESALWWHSRCKALLIISLVFSSAFSRPYNAMNGFLFLD
jgi:hypothetical protein